MASGEPQSTRYVRDQASALRQPRGFRKANESERSLPTVPTARKSAAVCRFQWATKSPVSSSGTTRISPSRSTLIASRLFPFRPSVIPAGVEAVTLKLKPGRAPTFHASHPSPGIATSSCPSRGAYRAQALRFTKYGAHQDTLANTLITAKWISVSLECGDHLFRVRESNEHGRATRVQPLGSRDVAGVSSADDQNFAMLESASRFAFTGLKIKRSRNLRSLASGGGRAFSSNSNRLGVRTGVKNESAIFGDSGRNVNLRISFGSDHR